MAYIAVVGAGTMGNGIAHVFALKGHEVRLTDTSDQALKNAAQTISRNLDRQIAGGVIQAGTKDDTLSRIQMMASLPDAVAEATLVIEAATERESVKLDIFRELDRRAPAGAILASNTSSLSITRLGSVTARPEQVIGMHFMNPVPVMRLVEVINGYRTAPAVTEQVCILAEQLGKTPCVVNDYPGFVSNRILMPMINEAIYTLFEGVAGVTQIDTVMKLGMAHPMGPLQLADFIGLDVCLSIMRILAEGFGQPKYAPCPLLVNMVEAGRLGRKTQEGFYDYREGGKALKVSARFS
jgi:3-hydroxybutyryl-CoA dehydrogenase